MSSGRIYGLLGRRLGHSYSVMIHRALGCDGYELIQREPEELAAFLTGGAIGGLNVTIPYKKAVMPFCRQLSAEARMIGSVNTVVPDGRGGLIGYNTDARGFIAMARRAAISLAGRKVVIFGSGGAQLAVRYAAAAMGAAEIITVSRGGENNYENLHRHENAQILVNATPVGMFPDTQGRIVDLARFADCTGVLDLVYNPYRTCLLLQAEALGIPYAGGLSMLAAQACLAEEYFTGRPVGEDAFARVLRLVSMQTCNLILVGMPGSGKSTVGQQLALLSGREVIDTDLMIEKAAGMEIPRIFSTYGEDHFRRLEHEVIVRAVSARGRIIVTGGGAVLREDNCLLLRRNGRVYHLERDVSKLARDGRPLSQNTDLAKLAATRAPMYARARDVCAGNNASAEEAAAWIWRDFCENSCH